VAVAARIGAAVVAAAAAVVEGIAGAARRWAASDCTEAEAVRTGVVAVAGARIEAAVAVGAVGIAAVVVAVEEAGIGVVGRIAAEERTGVVVGERTAAASGIAEVVGRTVAFAAAGCKPAEAVAAADTEPATPESARDSGIAALSVQTPAQVAGAARLPQPAPAYRAPGNPDILYTTANSHVRSADTPN
jgi:hypothetical protein